MRDIGYTLDTALADIIDNSISACSSTIKILANTSGEHPCIAIHDDGHGMSSEELLSAMRPGSRNPLADSRVHDLGRFGLGLKTASFSQCRRLSVLTRKNGKTTCAIWDLDHVASVNRWEVFLPSSFSDIPFAEQFDGPGTLVVWEKLDRIRGEKNSGSIAPQLDAAREHLELVFHRFLAGESGQPKIKMLLNGRPLHPFDPFNSGNHSTQRDPPEPDVLRLKGHDVLVQAFTLPHHRKVSKHDWDKYAGAAGYTKNQGFYVYRERRLIVYGTWFGLARQTEATKLARVRIDTPRELDAEWKIDVKKAHAQPPSELREHLRKLVERIGATAKRVYTYRGRVLTDDSRLPVWNRVQDKGEIHYRLNLKHPVIASLIETLDPEQATRFRNALELAAAALPLDALLADLSGKPEEIQGAAMSEDALVEAAVTTYEILASGATDRREPVLAMMSMVDPFRLRWPEVNAAMEQKFGWNA